MMRRFIGGDNRRQRIRRWRCHRSAMHACETPGKQQKCNKQQLKSSADRQPGTQAVGKPGADSLFKCGAVVHAAIVNWSARRRKPPYTKITRPLKNHTDPYG